MLFSSTFLCLQSLMTADMHSAHSFSRLGQKKVARFYCFPPTQAMSQKQPTDHSTCPPPRPPHAKDSSCCGFWRRDFFSKLLEPRLWVRKASLLTSPVCHDVHCCHIPADLQCQEWRKLRQGEHCWVKRGVREQKQGIKAHLRPVELVDCPNRGGGGGREARTRVADRSEAGSY